MTIEIDEPAAMGGQRRRRHHDAAISALAERQHSVVEHGQLLELGLGEGAIEHRLACGRLHAVHRGVYAVGGRRLTREGFWSAARLALGPRAVLSHRSAAALWGIRASAATELTVPNDRRAPQGAIVHRSRLRADEITDHAGFPVTTVTRTLLDLAAVRPLRELRKAVDEAERLRLGDTLSLADVVERNPGRRGIRNLRLILTEGRIGVDVTRSELEDRFLRFVARARLPRPRTNALVEAGGRTYECDCVWHEQRLVVELDGRETHSTTASFERDRERDRMLNAAGWRTIRITWRQLHVDQTGVRRDLRALLSTPRSTNPAT